MHDICVPIPHFSEYEIAEVEVKIGDKKSSFNFRIESFNWESPDLKTPAPLEEKISLLKHNIENYNKSWELVQIFTPSQGSKYIHVMFRQKKTVILD